MDPNTTASTTNTALTDDNQNTGQTPITTNESQLNDVIVGGAFWGTLPTQATMPAFSPDDSDTPIANPDNPFANGIQSLQEHSLEETQSMFSPPSADQIIESWSSAEWATSNEDDIFANFDVTAANEFAAQKEISPDPVPVPVADVSEPLPVQSEQVASIEPVTAPVDTFMTETPETDLFQLPDTAEQNNPLDINFDENNEESQPEENDFVLPNSDQTWNDNLDVDFDDVPPSITTEATSNLSEIQASQSPVTAEISFDESHQSEENNPSEHVTNLSFDDTDIQEAPQQNTTEANKTEEVKAPAEKISEDHAMTLDDISFDLPADNADQQVDVTEAQGESESEASIDDNLADTEDSTDTSVQTETEITEEIETQPVVDESTMDNEVKIPDFTIDDAWSEPEQTDPLPQFDEISEENLEPVLEDNNDAIATSLEQPDWKEELTDQDMQDTTPENTSEATPETDTWESEEWKNEQSEITDETLQIDEDQASIIEDMETSHATIDDEADLNMTDEERDNTTEDEEHDQDEEHVENEEYTEDIQAQPEQTTEDTETQEEEIVDDLFTDEEETDETSDTTTTDETEELTGQDTLVENDDDNADPEVWADSSHDLTDEASAFFAAVESMTETIDTSHFEIVGLRTSEQETIYTFTQEDKVTVSIVNSTTSDVLTFEQAESWLIVILNDEQIAYYGVDTVDHEITHYLREKLGKFTLMVESEQEKIASKQKEKYKIIKQSLRNF